MAQWLVVFDTVHEKAGDVYEGDALPARLINKVKPVAGQVFEVATPAIEPAPAPAKKPRAKKGA